MPRLIGRPSKAPVYLGIIALIAAVAALEFAGEIDVIPGFGRDGRLTGTTNFQNHRSRDPMAPRS